MKLYERVLITFLPTVVVFLIIIVIIYSIMMRALIKQILHNNFQTLVMISNDIYNSLDKMEDSAYNIIRSQNVQRYLYSDTSSSAKASVRSTFTRLFNYEINTTIPFSKSAYLIKNEEDYICIEPDPSMTKEDIAEFVTTIFKNNYNIYSPKYILPTRENFIRNGILHYVMPVPNLDLVTLEKSLLVINVSPTFITNIFQKYYDIKVIDSTFTVADYNGNLVCSMPAASPEEYRTPLFTEPPETGYYIESSKSGNLLVMNMRINRMGWVVTITVPLEKVLAPAKPYQILFLLLIIFSTLAFLLLLKFPTASIYTRIREMCETMEAVKRGQLNSRFPVKYNDEISMIGKELNNMIDSIQHMRLDIAELNLRQKEAELKALQSQINPHFLYNTLESIRMVALEKNCPEVATQIKTLSDTFRYTISPAGLNQQVYIYQEMAHVYDYLSIQSFRFKDRYEVKIDVDESILKYRTLKLILQPLLENAFTHGIRSMKSGGKIHMTGYRDGDDICFIISDNGVGMSEERLAELRRELSASPYEPRGGSSIGIVNVNDRLKLAFGEKYALQIESSPGKGTTVKIKFPVIEGAA